MKKLWIRDIPVNDDLLQFVLLHCVEKVNALGLMECKITNEIVEEIVKGIKRRENKVIFLINLELRIQSMPHIKRFVKIYVTPY